MSNTGYQDLALRVAMAPRPELPEPWELERRRITREAAQRKAGRWSRRNAQRPATVVRIPEQRRPALAAEIDDGLLVDA